MKLYIDGTLQAATAGPTWDRNVPGSIRLGTSLNGGAHFAGAIDELQLFNYTLDASRVAALATLLPSGWSSDDLGTPGSDGYPGHSAAGAGTFTVTGGGTGTGGTPTLTGLGTPEAAAHALPAGPPVPDGDFETYTWYYDVAVEDGPGGFMRLRIMLD